MRIYDSLKLAIRRLSRMRFRCFLTSISISLGVFTVIFINICSSSGIAAIYSEIAKMGLKCTVIKNSGITAEKISSVQNALNKDFYISTVIKTQGKILNEEKNAEVTVYGCDEEILNILNYRILSGRNITIKDLINNKKIIIIDSVTADRVFSTRDIIGKGVELEVNGLKERYTIVGITDSSKLLTNTSSIVPSCVFIPHTSSEKLLANDGKQIFISGKTEKTSEDNISAVLSRINASAKASTPLKAETTNIYKENVEYIAETMRLILLLIAFISVIAGFINMLNTIFIDINERKKEIAIKKAIGNKNSDFILLLVFENTIVVLFSVAIGIIFANLLSYRFLNIYGLEYIPDLKFQVAVTGISLISGICFGLIPLRKILKMNPVDIL